MLLRAGLLSFALLLASRLLGLLRESVQAAALGSGAQADVAILMLTLPDLLTGVLASGALAYVLLPLWAGQRPPAQAQTLQHLTRWTGITGAVGAVCVAVAAPLLVRALAPGLDWSDRTLAQSALLWSAVALPAALLAALWTTRLQHLRDFAGMYGANLVVNGVIVATFLIIATMHPPTRSAMAILGVGLLLGMGLRLLWLRWRLRMTRTDAGSATDVQAASPDDGSPALPAGSVWAWALASAGLPLLLPLLARSLASADGEGALSVFNYAWKLVELPLVLAVQLVASLAFPGIARAFAAAPAAGNHTARRDALRQAFVLAWVLACAAAAALAALSPALARLLFGWGRMSPDAVAQIADWARIGAWSLLPQAVLAVLLTLMASTGRLRRAVPAYGTALLALILCVWVGPEAGMPLQGGAMVMVAVNVALSLAALVLLVSEREHVAKALPLRDLAPAALAACGLAALVAGWQVQDRWAGLLLALLVAGTVLAVAWLGSPGLRRALTR